MRRRFIPAWLSSRLAGFTGIGAFLLVLGLRFALLQVYGNDLPFHDQWDAEALHVLRPMEAGAPFAPGIFRFHNEHHPVFTKVIAVVLAKLDGMWSAFPQMLLNTLFQGLIAMMLVRLARKMAGPACAWIIALAAAVTLSMPMLWENLLWGFQSQFYLAILLGLIHLDLTWSAPALGLRWGFGAIAGICTLGTIASGFLSVLASGIVALCSLPKPDHSRPHAIATLVLSAAVSVAGFSLIQPVPYPAIAHTVFSAAQAFAVLGSWPFEKEALIFILQLPSLLFIFGQFCRADRRLSRPWLLAAVLWLFAVTAGFAYGRAELIESATPRYCDFLTVLCLVNLICLLLFASVQPRQSWKTHGLVVGWIIFAGCGFYSARETTMASDDLGSRAALQTEQRKLVRDFILRDDATALLGDSTPANLIHAVPSHRLTLLRDPGMRGLLPPSVRAPLSVIAGKKNENALRAGFDEDNPISPGWTLTPAQDRAYFRSELIVPEKFPLFRVRVMGGMDGGSHILRLLAGPEERIVEPLGTARETTVRSLNFPMPDEPFRIEAEAKPGSGKFSFSDPVALSRLSWLSGKLFGSHLFFAVSGIIALLAGATGILHQTTATPPEGGGRIPEQWRRRIPLLLALALPAAALGLWPFPTALTLDAREALLLDADAWSARYVTDFHLQKIAQGTEVPAAGAVYNTVGNGDAYFGTYGKKGDETLAAGLSPTFKVEANYIGMAVVGYPLFLGNQLALEVIGGDGTVTETIAYSGANPGERPRLWLVDLSKYRNASVRLKCTDTNSGHQGWLGFGRPWWVDDQSVQQRWQRLADSNRLTWLRESLVVAGIAFGLLSFRIHQQKARPETQVLMWP